ncbi:MAG: hypothetical protein ACLQLC_21430 [Candidatus Sulfotelmatobacter sp.]
MKNKYVSPIAIGLGLVLALALRASAQNNDMQMAPAAPSEAQKSFDKLKTLAGTWEGVVHTIPPDPSADGKTVQLTLRVTSMGNALMHEMKVEGRPDDPITMLYLDGDRLMLTHYCDAGNRPRMTGKATADGKAVDFTFLDVAGPLQYGHMDHSVFSIIDANHHTEDWTFMIPGDKPVHARMELTRAK